MSARVYLLAAGRGRRAGGPKAWRDFGGKPMLQAQLEFLSGLFGAEHLSVSIQDEWLARCVMLAPKARFVPVDPDASPLASLQALWHDRPGDGYVLHVDMPMFDLAIWKSLRLDSVPTFSGRRGHPVFLSRDTLSEARVLDPAVDRLDAFLRTRTIAEIPVETDLVLANVNR